MDNAAPLLRAEGLCFGYPQHTVFQDWSVDVGAGATLVLGGEGSGKTTLLRLLAGAVAADAGTLVLAGVSWAQAPQAYQRQVFWQDPRSDALNDLTPRAWFTGLSQQHGAWDAAALQAHITGFLLQPHLDKPLYALSAGSRRKVLMAGALASGAPLTLIDEPVAGLDKPSVAYLAKALAHHGTQPGRMVVVAHYEALAGAPWDQVVDLPGRDAAALPR